MKQKTLIITVDNTLCSKNNLRYDIQLKSHPMNIDFNYVSSMSWIVFNILKDFK